MSAIFGFAACQARLAQSIREIDASVQAAQGPVAKAQAANAGADALIDFTNDSRASDPSDAAEVAAIAGLDGLARDTANSLTAMAISGLVTSISARSLEVEAIGKKLGQQTLANLDGAKRLRLVPLRDAIDRMTDTVGAVKVLAKSLDTSKPDEQAIAAAAADLAARFEALKKAIDQLRPA